MTRICNPNTTLYHSPDKLGSSTWLRLRLSGVPAVLSRDRAAGMSGVDRCCDAFERDNAITLFPHPQRYGQEARGDFTWSDLYHGRRQRCDCGLPGCTSQRPRQPHQVPRLVPYNEVCRAVEGTFVTHEAATTADRRVVKRATSGVLSCSPWRHPLKINPGPDSSGSGTSFGCPMCFLFCLTADRRTHRVSIGVATFSNAAMPRLYFLTHLYGR